MVYEFPEGASQNAINCIKDLSKHLFQMIEDTATSVHEVSIAEGVILNSTSKVNLNITKEKAYVIQVLRKQCFGKIKEELGEGYTDEDAENVFQMVIEKARTDGTIKKILDEYLRRKIQREKEQLLSSTTTKK